MGERFFMMMNLKGEDSLVMQLVAGQCFQHRQHGSSFGFGGGQIHIAVVAALHFAGTGHCALKASHEAEGLHRQLQCLGGGQAAGEQIEAGAAAYGANVDHAVFKGAVGAQGRAADGNP